MDYEVHRYRSACGRLTLAAREYPGQGPALLMMHGLTRNSADFEPLAAVLAGTYRLIVPDQRGRGLSDSDPDPANYRPDIYAADMFALLAGLGIARAGLIGTSMGGLIAMLMAAQRPETVASIVLNDIGAELDPAGVTRIQGYVGPGGAMASWDEAAARCRAINAAAFPDFGEAEWMAFARRTCVQEPDGGVRFAYDPAIAESIRGDEPQTVPADLWPLWDMLSDVPVLLVRGAISDLLSAATADEMALRHAGPFERVDVPRVGHAPILDEAPALTAIKPFLARFAG